MPLPNPFQSRRAFLSNTWNGIGALGLSGLLAHDLLADFARPVNPLTPVGQQRLKKAKHCIFLFMQGGVSQMDAFENKPLLRELADASGGDYFELQQLDQLAQAVPERKQTVGTAGRPIPLWDTSRVLLVLVLLLGCEWALRKRLRLL